MNNFTVPFSFTLPTKIVCGPGCISSLIGELQLNNGNKPIIVTDIGVRNAGILDKITSLLKYYIYKYYINPLKNIAWR